jgi:predicted Zn-dependent protease with MMP-like domain
MAPYDSAAMSKRRRGIPAAELAALRRRRAARHVHFEDLVDRAVAGIPMPFAAALDEVAIVIADEPSPSQRRENELAPDDTLYGLYEGTPRTAWGADDVPLPNMITIFRLPLEEDFADPLDLEDEVRITVIHELAHHLGIDDDRLEELGVD